MHGSPHDDRAPVRAVGHDESSRLLTLPLLQLVGQIVDFPQEPNVPEDHDHQKHNEGGDVQVPLRERERGGGARKALLRPVSEGRP